MVESLLYPPGWIGLRYFRCLSSTRYDKQNVSGRDASRFRLYVRQPDIITSWKQFSLSWSTPLFTYIAATSTATSRVVLVLNRVNLPLDNNNPTTF